MIRRHHFHDKIGDLIHILLSGHFETGFSSTTSTSPKLPAQLHLLQMWAQQDLCLQAEIVGQVIIPLCMLCQQYEPCISHGPVNSSQPLSDCNGLHVELEKYWA